MQIRYSSTYGSTKAYAEYLAAELGTQALCCEEHPATPDEPAIVLSPVHGPKIASVGYVREHQLEQGKLAVVAVGMTELADAIDRDQLKHSFGDHVARFYLPGRLFYSELSTLHMNMMRSLVTLLKAKPRKSRAERAIIDGYGRDIDATDVAACAPILEWAREQS